MVLASYPSHTQEMWPGDEAFDGVYCIEIVVLSTALQTLLYYSCTAQILEADYHI